MKKPKEYLVRGTTGGKIHIPKSMMDEMGWKINQKVVFSVATIELSDGSEVNELCFMDAEDSKHEINLSLKD